jgi:hypothetical protein
MQFKQIISMAMLASFATKGMAAPVPAATNTTEIDVVNNVQARSADAAANGKKKKVKKVDSALRTSPDKPEGCLEWIIVGDVDSGYAMGYCRLWEDIEVEEPDVTARDAEEKSVLDIAMPYWAVAAL